MCVCVCEGETCGWHSFGTVMRYVKSSLYSMKRLTVGPMQMALEDSVNIENTIVALFYCPNVPSIVILYIFVIKNV